jgi:uncharacterized membrane protein YidH (DUF202 family)
MISRNDKLVVISIVTISIMIGSGVGISQVFLEVERGTPEENGYDKVTIFIFLIIVSAIIGSISVSRMQKVEEKIG